MSNVVQQSSERAKFGLSEQGLTMFEETRNERFRSHCCTAMLTLFEKCGDSLKRETLKIKRAIIYYSYS